MEYLNNMLLLDVEGSWGQGFSVTAFFGGLVRNLLLFLGVLILTLTIIHTVRNIKRKRRKNKDSTAKKED